MIFSQRYHRALTDKRLTVVISDDARPKLSTCLADYTASVGVQRDPNDNWISNSSVVEEAILELTSEHGWDGIPGTNAIERGQYYDAFKHLIRHGEGQVVFDFIELAMAHMDQADREKCRVKINQIFDLHDCVWRIADGEFFKLDADFMRARLAAGAHEPWLPIDLSALRMSTRRPAKGSGDVKDAIIHAGKSFESVMKVMTGLEHANADLLIKAMMSQNYFDDLPESIRLGFAKQVMKTLPFLRNKLAGHGQGAEIVDVPVVYGELAMQLAATFHNFLISKHLERKPPEPVEPTAAISSIDDDIPF